MKTSLFALVSLVVLSLTSLSEAAIVYNTTYQALNGQRINAVVTIDGSFGSYVSYDQFGNRIGSGQLFNVQYQNFGGQPALTGQWQWQTGLRGDFFWRFEPTYQSFSGGYNGPGTGFWNGTLRSGGGQLGANGPYVP